MTTPLEDIGAMVKQERQRRGLEVTEVAGLAGMPHSVWYRVERGQNVHEASLIKVLSAMKLRLTVFPVDHRHDYAICIVCGQKRGDSKSSNHAGWISPFGAPSISNSLKGDQI